MKRALLTAAFTTALAGSAFLAPASAVTGVAAGGTVETVPNTAAAKCPSKYFCSYTRKSQGGRMYKTEANWRGKLTGIRSYYNNGAPDQGGSIVALRWKGGHRCVNPGEKASFSHAVTLTEVIWWSECPW